MSPSIIGLLLTGAQDRSAPRHTAPLFRPDGEPLPAAAQEAQERLPCDVRRRPPRANL